MIVAFRRLLYALIVLILLTALAVAWAVATPSGLRAALAVADRFLPAALTLGPARGTLIGGVELDGVAWRDQTVTVEIRSLGVELDPGPLLRGDIRLGSVRATGVAVTLPAGPDEAEPAEPGPPFGFSMPVPLEIVDSRIEAITVAGADWERRLERVELAAAMRGDRLVVSRLVAVGDWLGVDASGEARLGFPYPMDVRARWRYSTGDGQSFAGTGAISGDGQAWSLTHDLTRPLAIRSRGEVRRTDDGLSAELRNDWDRIEWPLPDGRTVVANDGQVTLEGWMDGYRFGADSRLSLDDLPEVQAEAAGSGGEGRLRLDELDVSGAPGRVRAVGSVEILPQLTWQVAFEAEEFRPHLVGAPIEATLTASGRSRGSLQDDGPVFDLELDALSGTYAGLEADGSGVARYGAGKVEFERFTVGVGDNRIRADGSAGDTLDLDLRLDIPRLGELWPELEGAVKGDLRLAGRIAEPRVAGTLTASGVSFAEIRIASLRLDGDGAGDLPSRLRIQARDLVVAGRPVAALDAELAGTPADNRLELNAETEGIEIGLAMSGSLEGNQWTGELRELAVDHPLLGEWRLREPTYLALARDGLDLGDACLDGPDGEELCAGAGLSAGEGLRVTADLSGLRLKPLEQYFPPGTLIDGSASASAELAWQEGRLNGEARLRVPRALVQTRLDEEEITEIRLASIEVLATIEDNRTALSATLDLGADGRGSARLESDDLLDPAASIDGELNLSFSDLALVSLLVPEVDQVRGVLEGRLEISGSRGAPILDGSVVLSDGSFEFPAAGIRVTEIRIRAAQDRAGRITYEGEAKSGQGTAAIRGESRREEARGWVSELTLRGDNFQIARLPDLVATASPDLAIGIDDRQVTVRGRLTVPRADITLRDLGEGAVAPSPDAVVHGDDADAEAEARQTLVVDVQVVLGDDVKLQGFGLQTELEGSVRLTGGSDAPWLGFGRVSLVGGRYKAYGQRLTVERGELAFSGPLDNPVLDLRATRAAGEVTAGIQVTGTVRSPRSTVFSEPAMTEAEALSYLLTGRPLASASSSDGDLLSSAALSLGLSQAGSVASQVRQSIGLDTLAVEGGSSDGRVLAGKRIGPDLYLQYAYGLFDRIGTLLVSYQLTDRLSLESRSGEYHALDFIYRVEKD